MSNYGAVVVINYISKHHKWCCFCKTFAVTVTGNSRTDVFNCSVSAADIAVFKDVPPSNLVNYDKTNLVDDPGRKKIIVKRGCRYPERVCNSTKSATSLMCAAAADGTMLPCYVVYKALHLYDTWTDGGPEKCRYNRSKSGWFYGVCFEDWFLTVVLPYMRRQEGKKVLLGDNLSSHLSMAVLDKCHQDNISFIFLPPNSTHLTQPLDVAFFRRMKIYWRQIIDDWKKTAYGRKCPTIPKDTSISA